MSSRSSGPDPPHARVSVACARCRRQKLKVGTGLYLIAFMNRRLIVSKVRCYQAMHHVRPLRHGVPASTHAGADIEAAQDEQHPQRWRRTCREDGQAAPNHICKSGDSAITPEPRPENGGTCVPTSPAGSELHRDPAIRCQQVNDITCYEHVREPRNACSKSALRDPWGRLAKLI